MMNEIEHLKKQLAEAATYFGSRAFSKWEQEALESIKKVDAGDLSVIDSLVLKYAPTCEVEELFITEYSLDQEDQVNKMNQELANVINDVFQALEYVQRSNT